MRCPDVKSADPSGYGYAMNAHLGGKKLSAIPKREQTPLLFDSSDTKIDAHGGLELLPKPGRHQGRNNVLLANGAVEVR